jgi:itaconate CoA-transferase
MDRSSLPLSRTRVVAFETGLAGPLCSRLLADLGAEVVKVERPGAGDVTRGWDTAVRGLSSGFVWVNRGKRSVALDVRDPAARPSIERLVARSDVFLHNFSPGWAERAGLDAVSVRTLRPDLVYTEITGYGPTGPYATKNAYDLVMQGETGMIAITGTPESPARVGISVCDVGAGSYAALGTLAALVRRARTGEGETVSVSLFDVMLDWLGYFPYLWWHRRQAPSRTGMRHPHFCPYGPYEARNGLFNLAVLSAEHWRSLCADVIERPELAEDERYATNEGRVAHRRELEPLLEDVFRERDAAEWTARLEKAEIPCGRVNGIAEVMEHPQLAHNRLVTEIGSPAGRIQTIGSAIAMGDDRPELGPVPGLGEHTREVLTELGLAEAEIDELVGDH